MSGSYISCDPFPHLAFKTLPGSPAGNATLSSLQPSISRLALLCMGEWTQFWLYNNIAFHEKSSLTLWIWAPGYSWVLTSTMDFLGNNWPHSPYNCLFTPLNISLNTKQTRKGLISILHAFKTPELVHCPMHGYSTNVVEWMNTPVKEATSLCTNTGFYQGLWTGQVSIGLADMS